MFHYLATHKQKYWASMPSGMVLKQVTGRDCAIVYGARRNEWQMSDEAVVQEKAIIQDVKQFYQHQSLLES
jgi:hypothetical protein